MSVTVLIAGLLIVLMALLIVAWPSRLKVLLWKLFEHDRFYFAAIFRIVFGVLFLLAAPSTRLPAFVQISGILMILAGLMIPIMGADRIRSMASWWLDKGDGVVRTWALYAMLFGTALIWVAT